MAERFVIVVTPPESDNGSLTVEDAMQQVLDAFQLLISSSEADESITWRLVEAKTNSFPLCVVGEAMSTRPGIDVDLIAKNQKKSFASNYEKLIQGTVPEPWQSNRFTKIARDFVSRNCNGVASTRMELDVGQSLILTKQDAIKAFKAFEEPVMEEIKPRSQIGSVEGKIITVGKHYNQPAILLRERITGCDIWCLVSEEYEHQISEEADFEDVWSGRRVRIRGKLEYDNTGSLSKVYAVDVSPISDRTIPLEAIQDNNFTNSLNINDYIDKLREGEID